MFDAHDMGTWEKVGIAILLLLIIFGIIQALRGNRNMLTMTNFLKGSSTMGVLALLLIGFISFCVYMLRH